MLGSVLRKGICRRAFQGKEFKILMRDTETIGLQHGMPGETVNYRNIYVEFGMSTQEAKGAQ